MMRRDCLLSLIHICCFCIVRSHEIKVSFRMECRASGGESQCSQSTMGNMRVSNQDYDLSFRSTPIVQTPLSTHHTTIAKDLTTTSSTESTLEATSLGKRSLKSFLDGDSKPERSSVPTVNCNIFKRTLDGWKSFKSEMSLPEGYVILDTRIMENTPSGVRKMMEIRLPVKMESPLMEVSEKAKSLLFVTFRRLWKRLNLLFKEKTSNGGRRASRTNLQGSLQSGGGTSEEDSSQRHVSIGCFPLQVW